jgi:hypothetical protein
LHDIQCMWFELESGESAARVGDVITALKQFHWVEFHFNQIRDDEFDFHEYCLRRFVLSSYANLVRMEDSLRSAPAFRRAVKGAVPCWLRVFDADEGLAALKQHEKAEAAARKAAEKDSDESRFAGMTPVERKRAMKKIKEEKEAKEKAEAAKKLEEAKKATSGASSAAQAKDEEDEDEAADEPAASDEKQSDVSGLTSSKPRRRRDIAPDHDPNGFKRFASLYKDPLKPAVELVDLALAANANDGDVQLLSFDVKVRKGDLSGAWKALAKAIELLSATAPSVMERLIPFARFAALSATPSGSPWGRFSGNKFNLDEASRAELTTVVAGLGKPMIELAVANLGGSDGTVAVSSAVGLLVADVDVDKALDGLSRVLAPLKAATRAQQILKARKPAMAEEHKKAAKARWPKAAAFS